MADISKIYGNPVKDETARESIATHTGDTTSHITAAERTAWNAKQGAISDLATIRSGASAGSTALQPSALTEHEIEYSNRLAAVSSAKTIIVKRPYKPYTVLEQFILDNKLDDISRAVDIKSVVESGSTKYYTSIVTAFTDLNAGVTTNSVTTSTDVDCVLCDNGAGVKAIVMLRDISLSNTTIEITTDVLIDYNGHKLSNSGSMGFKQSGNDDTTICFYGVKSGSGMSFATTSDVAMNIMIDILGAKCYLYIIGGDYLLTNTYDSHRLMMIFARNQTKRWYIDGITFVYNSNVSVTSFGFIVAQLSGFELTFKRNVIDIHLGNNTTPGLRNLFHFNYYYADHNFVTIDNCDIKVKTSGTVTDTYAALCGTNNTELFIRNTKMIAPNHSVDIYHAYAEQGHLYVENSKLYGGYHGGIYASNNGVGYIKDSTLGLISGYTDPNLYSAYFGYDSCMYLDNVIFDAYNASYCRPAIKTGGDTYKKTRVYMSNSKMNSIRCDANCAVYLGLGISETLKASSVSGIIVDSGTETYSYRVVELTDNLDESAITQINSIVDAKLAELGDNAVTQAAVESAMEDIGNGTY